MNKSNLQAGWLKALLCAVFACALVFSTTSADVQVFECKIKPGNCGEQQQAVCNVSERIWEAQQALIAVEKEMAELLKNGQHPSQLAGSSNVPSEAKRTSEYAEALKSYRKIAAKLDSDRRATKDELMQCRRNPRGTAACAKLECPSDTECRTNGARAACIPSRSDGSSSTDPEVPASIGRLEFFRPTGPASNPCPEGAKYLRKRGVCMRQKQEGATGVVQRPTVSRGQLRRARPVDAPQRQASEATNKPTQRSKVKQCRKGYIVNPSSGMCELDKLAVMKLYCKRLGKNFVNKRCL